MSDVKFCIRIQGTYLAEVGNISVEIFRVFFDDQVTVVFDFFTVAPLN